MPRYQSVPVRAGRAGRPGRAGPGRVSINNSEEVSRVLEAQVPSVPRSHRSQGPIGPPKVSHPKVSHPRDPWVPIYGYPYMDIHIWIFIYGYPYMDIHIWISIYG